MNLELKRVTKILLTESEFGILSKFIHLKTVHEVGKVFSINRWIRKHYDIPVRTIEVKLIIYDGLYHFFAHQLYGGEFRGKRMMTDDDLKTIIYEGEIEVRQSLHYYIISVFDALGVEGGI